MPVRKPNPNRPAGVPGAVTPRGPRWVAQLPPQPDGKRPSQTFDTESDAWQWLAVAHWKTVLRRGRAGQASRMSLRDAMTAWLDGLLIKDSTRAGYWRELRPTLDDPRAATPLCDVNAQLIEDLLKAAPMGHPRARTVDRFRAFFHWATIRNHIEGRDPFLQSEAERIKDLAELHAAKTPTTGLAWTVPEARALLDNITEWPFRVLIAFMLVTGVRRGEALGLGWGGVKQHRAEISRNRTVAGGKIITELRPKTYVIRDARYGPNLAAMLESIRPAGHVKHDAYVFTGRDGEPIKPAIVTMRLPRIAFRANVPAAGAAHALRRTFATALDTDGCPALVREALLGHAGSVYARAHDADMYEWAVYADELFLGGLD